MKLRLAIWAMIGFLVADAWLLYASISSPGGLTPARPVLWTLAGLTQPIALASIHFHFGVRFYWALLANAATYALLGLMVEGLRRSLRALR